MSKTKIYLIRHGETIWNATGRFQGQQDSPLNETGIRQAQALAKRLRNKPFFAIYSSDLGRAHQTAEILAEPHSQPVIPDERLRERRFGIFEGLTMTEAERDYPDIQQAFLGGGYNFIVPGGETNDEIIDRTVSCLNELATRHPGERLLVVTHGGIINRFTKYVLGIPQSQQRMFRVHNASVNKFVFENGNWEMHTFGDTSHFEIHHDGAEE